MDVLEYTPTREQYAFTFGGAAAAMRIKPGAALRLWSEDAFNGALRSVDDLSAEKVDLRFVNPQTGPFYVEGAQPGDTLVLHLVALEPARDWAASATIPFFGGMTSTDRTVTLQDALPDTTWIYQLDRARNTMAFAARHSDHVLELPIEPMLGTVGVAPAGGEVRSSIGRLEPIAIQCVSSSTLGQAGAWPLMSSTMRVDVMAPSTAVPQASPSPWR